MIDESGASNESSDYGRSLRESVPLESLAEWSPAPNRTDPVRLVEEQNEDRIPWLVPVRRARMSASPFAFYRGAARIMACDLATTPVSGLQTQLCGDAHLSNFGNYASPERRLVFDLNDFDETLPGPWEWDLKRLAASLYIAGRHNGLGRKESRRLARTSARGYRKAMATLAGMRLTDIWHSLVEFDHVVRRVESRKTRKKLEKQKRRAKRKTSRQALDKLAEDVGGEYRIRSEPPLIVPARDIADTVAGTANRDLIHASFEDYQKSLPDNVEHLLRRYRPVDFAIKVVGVGSVGTHSFILLLEGRDRKDPLFLQIKEASKSVLEEHLPASRYRNSGHRVVEGQRLMQAVSDIFLGWTKAGFSGHHYYVRQLKDWKMSLDVESMTGDQLAVMASNRGWTLARAHARAGDPVAMAGYLGEEREFDRAIAAFAERYAAQNQADYDAFLGEIESGHLEAREYKP
ncbi:MAG: DUF2252 domain-containing protein [Planctomycetota bacterium]|jgi:uncharacterized protein (DUF2252 family)